MLEFYKGKRVFITGHTGFKGSWLCKILTIAGATVKGYSLSPDREESLFNILHINKEIESVFADIRDLERLKGEMSIFKPDIVFHLAAQPLVRESYKNPVYTYETNVMGTINLLESIRESDSVRSVINVTTDKVYYNHEWEWGYRENDTLNGYDPYSNSKSCSELVTSSYKKSFFTDRDIKISTARAGNVIGGGDFSENRIIPDCVRAAIKNKDIEVRNPNSIRPYQHVLDAISAYLLIAEKQYNNNKYEGCYNIGPNEESCITTSELVDIFCASWNENIKWVDKSKKSDVHEAQFLKLDSSKIKRSLGWSPKININKAVELTVDWEKGYYQGKDIDKIIEDQIINYFD